MLKSLRERNVRVRVLTNSLLSTDVPAVHAGYRRYRVPLLEEGVELYEVKPLPGKPQPRGGSLKTPSSGKFSLHAKAFVFDRKRIFIGSANFDQRSLHLNTEIGLMIESPELARQVVARFDAIAQPANSFVLALENGGGSDAEARLEKRQGRQTDRLRRASRETIAGANSWSSSTARCRSRTSSKFGRRSDSARFRLTPISGRRTARCRRYFFGGECAFDAFSGCAGRLLPPSDAARRPRQLRVDRDALGLLLGDVMRDAFGLRPASTAPSPCRRRPCPSRPFPLSARRSAAARAEVSPPPRRTPSRPMPHRAAPVSSSA